MKKKLIALLLIMCMAGPPLFAIYEDESNTAAALMLTGEPVLIALGIGLVVLMLSSVAINALSAADKPSDGIYLVSDDGSVAKEKEKKVSILNYVKPVVDFQYKQAGNTKTFIGVQLSF